MPDAAPLIHLAGAGALHVLNGMGRVIVPDIIVLETTDDLAKPQAREIAAWLAEGQASGSNRPIEIVSTEIGTLYRIALDQGLSRPRHAGKIGIATWLADDLRSMDGPALVIYENGRVPNLLRREGIAATIAVATTRNLLEMAELEGLITDASSVWDRISHASPTAKPGFGDHLHPPGARMTDDVHPVIRRYAAGEISAMTAATLLGEPASVADVIDLLRRAGLPPPLPPPEQQRTELAHARRVLGFGDTE